MPNYNEEFIIITTAAVYGVVGPRRDCVIKMDGEFNIPVATRFAVDEGADPQFYLACSPPLPVKVAAPIRPPPFRRLAPPFACRHTSCGPHLSAESLGLYRL